MRKRTKRKYVPKCDGLIAIHSSQPFSEAAKTELKTKVWMAWAAFKAGSAKHDDFDLLAATANVSLIRAEAIGQQAVILCKDAQSALMDIRERHDRLGKFGIDAKSLDTLPDLLDFYCELIDNSTPRQMADAVEVAFQRLNKQIFFKKD